VMGIQSICATRSTRYDSRKYRWSNLRPNKRILTTSAPCIVGVH
jgi:hypothetical protein